MARFRFNLRTVFVLATAVVLFLGYSQYRRRTILREAESLKQSGAEFHIDSEWRDLVWQRAPDSANIPVQKMGDRFRISSNWQQNAPLKNGQNAQRIASRVRALKSDLERIGVDDVHIIFVDFSTHTSRGMSEKELAEYLRESAID